MKRSARVNASATAGAAGASSGASGGAAPAPSAGRRVPRIVPILLGGAVLAVVGAFAVPGFLSDGTGDLPAADVGDAVLAAPAPWPDPDGAAGQAPDTSGEAEIYEPAPPPVATETVAFSADGDLGLEVSVRFPEVPSGALIPATVRFLNRSPREIHIPAAGEAHPTLALVLIDAEGREVRRVVETGTDPLPRRTRLLAPGAVVAMPQTLVSRNDEPLPPGRYALHAEFRADPAWARLGLPVWTAPRGSLRSELVTLTITERR
jgi:hypothetical protein